MNVNIDSFISNVVRADDGIWRVSNQHAVSYPDDGHDCCHAIEDQSFWFQHRNRCLQAVVTRFAPPVGLPFLDVGGGNGYVAAMLQDLGHQVVLIEPGEAGIRNARERGIAQLVCASTTDLDVRPGSVSAIGLFDVLEHIEDDAAALVSLREMLADGGRLYLTVPAHSWLWSSVDEGAGHYRRYTACQLRELLVGCGYEVTFQSYNFAPLVLPMLLLRCLPEWLGIRRGSDRMRRASAEHVRHGLLSRIVDWLLGLEIGLLSRRGRVAFGASCIVVATKDVQTKSIQAGA